MAFSPERAEAASRPSDEIGGAVPAGGQRFPGMERRAEDRRLPNEHRTSACSPTPRAAGKTTGGCDHTRSAMPGQARAWTRSSVATQR